jgi:hypothetical protein
MRLGKVALEELYQKIFLFLRDKTFILPENRMEQGNATQPRSIKEL